MKTPEEIKLGLECCINSADLYNGCNLCPYNDEKFACFEVQVDALAYIWQLEREKETLLAGIKLHGGICMMCKYYSTPEYELPCGNCCVIYPNDREAENLWEWRGVEEEQ